MALLGLLALSALRLTRLVARHRRPSIRIVAVLAAIALVPALVGAQPDPAGHIASAAAARLATQVHDDLNDQRDFERALEQDPYRNTPSSDLLTRLRGKDVLLVFVESYGRTALDYPVVQSALDAGDKRLQQAGFSSRTGFLTSPTFGGLSWLAHSSLQSGLWVNSQQRYDHLVTRDRVTLTDAFGRAGWRTVADVPSNEEDWSVAKAYYHYDQVYDRRNVGYAGPSFSYASMPDQYTLAELQRLELGKRNRAPVMAEVDLVSSHTPWAPLPRLVDWSKVGDGSVFDQMPAEGDSPDDVWPDPDRVKAAYAQSIAYSLDAVTSFVQQAHDPNLVLVVLGDHQLYQHRLRRWGEPRRAGEHHRGRPGRDGSGSGLGLAGRAAAGRRRTSLADGYLPGPVPHRLRPLALAHLLGISVSGSEPRAHWCRRLFTRRITPVGLKVSGCRARSGRGDRLDVGEGAAGVPGGEGSDERRGAVELDAAVAGGFSPAELACVPFDEGFGFRRDVEVLVEAGVRLADLGVAVLDQQPVPFGALAAGEVEADDDAPTREPVSVEHVAHRPQGHKGIEVLGGDLEPGGTPLAERHADLEEVVTRGCELVMAPAPVRLGCRLDDAESFELLEPLREHGAGEPGRSLQDLTEAGAPQIQVADDQRRPALGEDLGATSDGAVLAVCPHDASVAPLPSAVKSRFLTSPPGPMAMRWGCRQRKGR